MQLIIDDYGTFVGKQGNRFRLESKETREEFSTEEVDQIIILRASSLSSEAVKLAMEHNIDIVYLDHFGKPVARIYPCRLGGTTLTRRKQAETTASPKAMRLSQKIVAAKIRNQIGLLRSLDKSREGIDFSSDIAFLSQSLENLLADRSPSRDAMQGVEGFCSARYFSCLSRILPFTERQHEARDPFNAMLNYGYGILYSEIEKACILAGLDPYLGFLHSDRYGKPSMVLDVIENFRQPVVDRAIITLFAQKQIVEADTAWSDNSLLLTTQGKKKVIEAVLGRLHTEIEHKGKRLSLQAIILEECRSLARYIREDGYRHTPFVMRW